MMEPMASVDASFEFDPHDGRTRAGHDIVMAGGPVLSKYSKLQKVSFSIPGAESMQFRNCDVDVIWLRNLSSAIGLQKRIEKPAEIHCDSSGAIDWAKFGKRTVGNKHIALAYHEVQLWNRDKLIVLLKVLTAFNKSDIYAKIRTFQMAEACVLWNAGYKHAPPEFLKYRLEPLALVTKRELDGQNDVSLDSAQF